MKCAIMQPTYIPWSGYFNLIKNVDKFVFLDDVQFEKRSWQSRNRVLNNGSQLYLTVPTEKEKQTTLINEIKIDNTQEWKKKHWKTILNCYKNSSFGAELIDILEPCYKKDYIMLSDLNIKIITAISHAIGLNTECFTASSLLCKGKRSYHLIDICNKINCDSYLSPIGSKEYLVSDNFESLSDVNLTFQNYTPRTYKQHRSLSFISHLSFIDVIANLGIHEAMNYID